MAQSLCERVPAGVNTPAGHVLPVSRKIISLIEGVSTEQLRPPTYKHEAVVAGLGFNQIISFFLSIKSSVV